MPGHTTVFSSTSSSNPQKPLRLVLKKIMDILPPNILEDGDDEIEKEKLSSAGDEESCGDGGGGGSGGVGGVSASLTPTIWDKTIPYDGENFHLEYMDLDEFLLENQIPAALEEELHKSLEQEAQGSPAVPEVSGFVPQVPGETEKAAEVRKIKGEDEKGENGIAELQVMGHTTEPKAKHERTTPSPINPEEVEVSVNFQPDPADLVLSSIPGGELFNPRKHRFSEEELKPQPMIKKSKKVFVPEDSKDEKYWMRRKKNNVAAKRSRDARRLKENQIAVRANFLERENAALRQEVAELRKNCSRCKKIMALYESKYGPL
ncbi:TEF transcription factor, PAR bZIP family member b isoform X1 [Tachysurus fulvidraco]|uniref:TEF transcription factor, PAR bZIP family member b isoform X1 n=1 Tax=Tachysurus fulvidraco TaxID=1234273 RepID=UPI001FF06CA1|nr:TEF transcription factor, PAR bZIP family member b isoform X1 [Tachysurus fulvidraco]